MIANKSCMFIGCFLAMCMCMFVLDVNCQQVIYSSLHEGQKLVDKMIPGGFGTVNTFEIDMRANSYVTLVYSAKYSNKYQKLDIFLSYTRNVSEAFVTASILEKPYVIRSEPQKKPQKLFVLIKNYGALSVPLSLEVFGPSAPLPISTCGRTGLLFAVLIPSTVIIAVLLIVVLVLIKKHKNLMARINNLENMKEEHEPMLHVTNDHTCENVVHQPQEPLATPQQFIQYVQPMMYPTLEQPMQQTSQTQYKQ